VLGMSDRVLVMYDGRLVADLPATEATPERVIALASGEEMVQLASVTND
jgi:ABC-type sugar transport system ATPase subunit